MADNHYKRTFSQIRPSDETIERIFEMSEKKNKRIKFKGLFVAAACLAALLCGTLTANASTDGALFEGIQLIVNGEDVNIVDYIKNYNTYVQEDGAVVSEYEFEMPDGNGEASIIVNNDVDITAKIEENEDGNSVSYEIHE